MDPFVLGVLIFAAVCVGMFVLCVLGSKSWSAPSNKPYNISKEDQNLKYLQEIKRYEYWRENGKQSTD